MTAFIRLSTKKYPLYEGDVRLQVSGIPEHLTGNTFPCPDIYAKVEWVDPPEHDDKLQVAYEVQPVEENGVWKMQWAVRDLTQEEKEHLQFNPNGFEIPVERI